MAGEMRVASVYFALGVFVVAVFRYGEAFGPLPMFQVTSAAWHRRRLTGSVSAVVRLRFVQEYRGRRIVTDGKLYGIEGELITDCRYLNVQGARAAINSEAGIEERRRYIEWHRQQMTRYATTALKDRTLGCMCGWRGSSAKLNKDKFGVVILCCPDCKRDIPLLRARRRGRGRRDRDAEQEEGPEAQEEHEQEERVA